MPFLLLFLFLAYPLLEIALLIRVGGSIGLLATLGIVIGTAMLGMATLRRQGLVVMRRAAETMREGRPPVEPVLEGALFGLGGMLLVVPGLLSDAAGLALLFGPLRRLIARAISRSLGVVGSTAAGRAASDDARQPDGESHRQPPGPIVIEGEFTRLDERPVSQREDDRKGTGSHNGRT
jgi:UPF0716 protein FxsA